MQFLDGQLPQRLVEGVELQTEVRGLQPLETLDLGVDLVALVGKYFVLREYLFVQPNDDVVDDLGHVLLEVLREQLVLLKLFVNFVVECVEALFDTGPLDVLLAQRFDEDGCELLLEHFLNEFVD